MTKSHERGDNEITRDARKQAAKSGQSLTQVLRRWLAEAKRKRDNARVTKIIKAQKYLGLRNRRKRK